MKFDSVMIDIETLGKLHLPTAAVPVVTEIGLVFFNYDDPSSVSCQYGEIKLSVEKSIDAGLVTDDSTIEFWMKENSRKLQEMLDRSGKSPAEAIDFMSSGFDMFLRPKYKVWAKSPSFDCAILKAVAEKVGKNLPWKYFSERDVRTSLDHEGIPDKMFPGCSAYGIDDLPDVEGKLHDAIWDAVRQANQVRCASALRSRRGT